MVVFVWAIIGALVLWAAGAQAASVPPACRQYQQYLTQYARATFGIDAPVATLAAQIQQESSCNAAAKSPFAAGLTQFTPGTASDITKRHPLQLGSTPTPLEPRWAIRAQNLFMRELVRRYPGKTECDTWAFGFSAYNGGPGWVNRDKAMARAKGVDPNVWFGAVELTPDPERKPANIAENRGYPRRILLTITPVYIAGGYGRGVLCTKEATP